MNSLVVAACQKVEIKKDRLEKKNFVGAPQKFWLAENLKTRKSQNQFKLTEKWKWRRKTNAEG